MLNSKLNFRFFTVLIVLIVTISFQACQYEKLEDEELELISPDDQLILDHLKELNAPTENIDLKSDFIGYHDCSGWNKKDLLDELKGINSSGQDISKDFPEDFSGGEVTGRQRGINDASRWSAVTAANVRSLDYFIRPSVAADCGPAWSQAIVNAANAWNNLSHSGVNFRRVWSTGAADIVIGSDEDTTMPSSHRNLETLFPGRNVIARAGFSSSGRAFRFICISDTSDNWSSKLKTMMHEFGHCLGYRHTGTSDGQQIPGTVNTDANSIMNQGVNTNPAWTTNDQRAIRMYYPQRLDKPVNVTVNSTSRGRATIRLRNPASSSRPYYWVRVLRYSNTGAYQGTTYSSGVTDGSGFITINWSGLPSGNSRFQVQAENFRRDVISPRTSTITVNIR